MPPLPCILRMLTFKSLQLWFLTAGDGTTDWRHWQQDLSRQTGERASGSLSKALWRQLTKVLRYCWLRTLSPTDISICFQRIESVNWDTFQLAQVNDDVNIYLCWERESYNCFMLLRIQYGLSCCPFTAFFFSLVNVLTGFFCWFFKFLCQSWANNCTSIWLA